MAESLCIDDLEPCLTVGVGGGLWSTLTPGMSGGVVGVGGFPSTVTGPELYSRGYDRDLSSTSKSARTGLFPVCREVCGVCVCKGPLGKADSVGAVEGSDRE